MLSVRNNIAQDFHQTWIGRTQYRAIGKFLSQLPQRELRPPKILDAGCGPGHYLNIFYSLGFEYVGFDLSEKMVSIAQQEEKKLANIGNKYTPFPRVAIGNFLNIDSSNGGFDGIWCSAVIVHVPRRQLQSIISNLYNILKDDGIIYISALKGSGSSIRREGRVFFYYTETELMNLFGHNRLKIIDQWSEETDVSSRGGKRKKEWMHYLLSK